MADIHTNENIVNENIEIDSSTYEQDNQLPIANVTRIIKKILPPGSKISKDAKECIQECVTEFVCFIAGEYVFLTFNLFLILNPSINVYLLIKLKLIF